MYICLKTKPSLGSKGVSRSAAACYQILLGHPPSTASAVTRATPASCAAWDFSRETSIEVTDDNLRWQTSWSLPKTAPSATVKREWSTAKARLYHELNKNSERDEA